MKRSLLIIFLITRISTLSAQLNQPWQNALIIMQSNDGINFNSPAIFQDSSGVPCIIQWKSDTLVAIFQWFRQPMGSPTWDRVAVKFSYDNGNSWTNPSPIVVNNIPATYQRPFDPTLVVTQDKKLRVYFSSSDGFPVGGLDGSINTYSAISTDGINYSFEPSPRFDHPTTRVIDPALTILNGVWHYLSPIGAPQDGAYHAISNDGLSFTQVANISSDNTHNWTGNLLADGGLLRFYGCGQIIWYKTSTDGATWNSYVNTNIMGGDPGVVKLSTGKYLMVYVGPNTVTTIGNPSSQGSELKVFPNPFSTILSLKGKDGKNYPYCLYTAGGMLLKQGNFTGNIELNTAKYPRGTYLLTTEVNNKIICSKLVKN